jgi:hypothetical protein
MLPSCLLAQEEGETHIGVPTDWSHRHMVFSAPRSPREALDLSRNPRYVQQWLRRNIERRHRSHGDLKSDWSVSMGAGATVGAGQYPAKYTLNPTTDSCASDFVVFNTSLAGATGQASIIAYNNLYSGCSGTVPSVYWAYDTGGTIGTSVTFSADGSQLAFVQAEGGKATLVVLKWAASTTETVSAPTVLSNTATTSYRACTAPCMTTLTFTAGSGEAGTITDTDSSPFYDYTASSDTLYVGDDIGYLHQFKGVFDTTPAETTSTFPIETATAKLSGPVFDSATGNVFVTTSFQTSNNSGGRLQTVCATTTCGTVGTRTSSGILGPDTGSGACHTTATSGDAANLRLDSPIVDSTAAKVYVFIGNDGTGSSAVYQFPTTPSAGSCGTETTIGGGSTTGIPVFSGTFDNVYFTSSSGSSPSGNLYVCGNTSGDATLYQVPISANVIAASGTSVVAVSTANTTCSPMTEVFSASIDLVFLSTEASGVSTTCAAAGCVYNVKVTAWQPSTTYAVGQEILDTHFQIQVVKTGGKSNTAAPTWSTTTGGTTTDNAVTWLNQGPVSTTITAPAFATGTAYSVGNLVFDTNGNIERSTTAGTSGGQPVWQTAPGATTSSNGVTWENLGANGTAALSAAGGASGIVIDNTVAPGTLSTSQVYFSTLTGGTAVQASQAALK